MILKVGELFDERYRIISQLGEGSVGTVYRAAQIDDGREVAIKLLHAANTASEKERERFLREFTILAQLSNEHIVTFYSASISPEGIPYAAFELIHGRDLHQTIESQTRLPYSRVIKIAEQVCLAMEYAHGQGIIHRDLKPENIMLLEKPEPDWVKILDFGFALDISPSGAGKQKLTATGMVVGTVCYLSPEQCKGGKALAQSDVYALACILYECLTGHLLFEASTPLAVVQKQIYEDPAPALKQLQALVPERFIPILRKALSKDPAKRHQSMAELKRDLQALPRDLRPASVAGHWGKKAVIIAAILLVVGLIVVFLAVKANLSVSKKSAAGHHHAVSKLKIDMGQSPAAFMLQANDLIDKNDLAGAETCLKAALEKALRDKEPSFLFQFSIRLTDVYSRLGDQHNSRAQARETVDMAQRYFGKQSAQYFDATKILGDNYKTTDPQKAKTIFAELLHRWIGVNKTASLEFIELLADYIALLQADGAHALADQELAQYKSLFDSPVVPPFVLTKYLWLEAESKYLLGDKKAADKLARAGTEIVAKNGEFTLEQRTGLIKMWSEMLFQSGEKEKALQVIQSAESKLKSENADESLAGLYMNLADSYCKSGGHLQALVPLERAYKLFNGKKDKKTSTVLSQICYFKSACYLKLSQFDKAKQCIDESIKSCPADNPVVLKQCVALQKDIERAKSRDFRSQIDLLRPEH